MRRSDGAVRRIAVEVVEAPRRLRFRWWPFVEPGAIAPLGSSTVEFMIEEVGGTTRLRVIERAPLPTRQGDVPAPRIDMKGASRPDVAGTTGEPMARAARDGLALVEAGRR
jgi:hypothetical protein